MNKFSDDNHEEIKQKMNNIILLLFNYSTKNSLINSTGTSNNIIGHKGKDEKLKLIFKKKIISNLSSINLNKIKNEEYQIFNKLYKFENKEKLIYNFGKIIYFSYKKNFPEIFNLKGKKFTCDSGWGCMIRCSQMILARGLYKYFKRIGFSTKYSLIHSTEFFLENPFPFEKMPDNFINMMNYFLQIWYENHKNENIFIQSIYPPFSIKNICLVGRICNKDVGEWFSDVNMCFIFKLINENFQLLKNLKIFTFQSYIKLNDIINECFVKECNLFQQNDFIENKGEKYYFQKTGIIFVSIRIGINVVSEEYYKSLRELFLCKYCLGIIGGKERLAYYFIGYDNKGNLLYLDPHNTNESQIKFDENVLIQNYLIKNIYSIPINKITSAFTIGFYFRNGKEFMELVNFLENYVKQEFPCFILSEHDNDTINIDNNELMNDIDDF